jgi:hypothetical protein
VPDVFVVAEGADIVITIASVIRTEDDYSKGKISNTRRWALNITAGAGVINLPPPFLIGLAAGLFNMVMTFTGLPK